MSNALSRGSEIADARVSALLPGTYRWFVERYGGGMVGSLPVFGLRYSEVMGNETVVDVTDHYRRDTWPGANDWIVVSAGRRSKR